MTRRPHPSTDRPLAAPSLLFDLPREISSLKSESAWTGGKRSITLLKEDQLRVVLIAMHAGAAIEEHLATGELTLQVLEGRISVTVAATTRTLVPGAVLALRPRVPHAVQAVEESVFLLTLAQVG